MSEHDLQASREERAKMVRLQLAIRLIQKVKEEHEGHDWSGQAICPVCGGVLTLVHDGPGGHTSGQRSTEGCLTWME